MSLEKTMNSMSWMFATNADRGRTRQEILTDHRTRLALEVEARAHRRMLDLAEQCSESNPPEARVGTWEKLHGLRMPSNPEHPILDVIAMGTRLKLCDVQAVQAARKQRAPETAATVSSAPENHASVANLTSALEAAVR